MVDVTVCNGNVVLPATWLVSYFGNTSPEAVPAGVRASITGETLWVSDVYHVLQFLKALPQVCGVIAHWARGCFEVTQSESIPRLLNIPCAWHLWQAQTAETNKILFAILKDLQPSLNLTNYNAGNWGQHVERKILRIMTHPKAVFRETGSTTAYKGVRKRRTPGEVVSVVAAPPPKRTSKAVLNTSAWAVATLLLCFQRCRLRCLIKAEEVFVTLARDYFAVYTNEHSFSASFYRPTWYDTRALISKWKDGSL
jgi:hypothetical protein